MSGSGTTNNKGSTPDYNKRRRIVLGVLGVGLTALVWSAGSRQVAQSDYLQIQGERRYLREVAIAAHRGEISDRNGEPLAISSPMVSVWADPRHLPESPNFITALAKRLGMPADELQGVINKNKKDGFVYLQRGLSPEAGECVLALIDRYRLGSMGLEREYRRYYPSGEVTAHVIGITGANDQGQEGQPDPGCQSRDRGQDRRQPREGRVAFG